MSHTYFVTIPIVLIFLTQPNLSAQGVEFIDTTYIQPDFPIIFQTIGRQSLEQMETIYTFQITDLKSNKRFQVDSETTHMLVDIQLENDINFDGFNDLEFIESANLSGNSKSSFWLFNAEKMQLEKNEDFCFNDFGVDKKIKK